MKCWQEGCFVVFQVWTKRVSVKSDFARERAETLAWASSRRYITTESAPWTKDYGNIYKVTSKGLLLLEELLHGLDREKILEILSGRFEEDDGEQQSTFRFD